MKKFLFIFIFFYTNVFASNNVMDKPTITPVPASDYLYIVDGGTADGKATISSVMTSSESVLEGVLDLQDLQGAVTDAQVPNDITVNAATTASTATALAANGSNCSAGSYPLGVDASGAVESCTDATTEINSAISAAASNYESATSNDFDPDRLAGDTSDDNLIDEGIISADIARDSELPTQSSLSVDDLITLSGVSEGSITLGTFTGSTITDNQTIKAAIQELETAVEGLGGGHDAVTLSAFAQKWMSLSTQEIGLVLTDPGADRIPYWNDTGDAFGWIDYSGWDTNSSDDFDGAYTSLTSVPTNIDEDSTDDLVDSDLGVSVQAYSTVLAALASDGTDFGTLTDGYICTYDLTGTEIDCNTATSTFLASAGTDNVNDTHIDWGTGANQVSTDDITEGSTNKFEGTTAGDYLTLTGEDIDLDAEIYTKTIGFVLETPADADAFLLWKTPYALTITDIDCVTGAATSAVIDIQECDSAGANCATVDATITCDADGAADDGTLSNGGIDANDWIKLDIGTVTGTVKYVAVTIKYTPTD